MDRKSNSPIALSVSSMILVLAIAWGCDAATQFITYQIAQDFSRPWIISYFWSSPVFVLLLAAIWLLLFWITIFRTNKNVWVGLIYLLVGLFIILYPAFYNIPVFCCWIPDIRIFQIDASTKYLQASGGVIIIIGLFALFRPAKGIPLNQH
jgi:hypothetical protein